MIAELTVHAAESLELFVQTLFVLEETPFLDSEFVTWLYYPLSQ